MYMERGIVVIDEKWNGEFMINRAEQYQILSLDKQQNIMGEFILDVDS